MLAEAIMIVVLHTSNGEAVTTAQFNTFQACVAGANVLAHDLSNIYKDNEYGVTCVEK